METRYIKINYEDALSAKKELLNSELNSLTIARKLKEFRYLRRKEYTLKLKLKTALSILKSKNNLMLTSFPDDKGHVLKPAHIKKSDNTPEKNIDIELEEIRKKLDELNK